MIKTNQIIIFFLILSFTCCISEKKKNESLSEAKTISTDLQVDHFNIWVKNPKTAKKRLTDIGFTSLQDSLSPIHKRQGTAGRYFYFLNSYFELIFVYDQTELEQNNTIHKDLDFIVRANFQKNGASPYSIALKMKEYDVDKIPFQKVKYHQEWMNQDENIYAAKNSKTHLKEPSIFVVPPKMQSGTFDSTTELKKFQTDDPSWKLLFKHPNGAEKITNIVITSTDLDLNSETIKALNLIENITVKNGSEHLMELYFDDTIQGKSFDLRPELPLIIHL
ncbi:VOC family protein [Maribacter chungangensis]|uniref:VOC family protein n=2 Tax=Maribacter chungangensis TaxID=1069117 RepID=A0ABW3B0N8_9FLAO